MWRAGIGIGSLTGDKVLRTDLVDRLTSQSACERGAFGLMPFGSGRNVQERSGTVRRQSVAILSLSQYVTPGL